MGDRQKEDFILYEKSFGGWYEGKHHKYKGIFLMVAVPERAKKMSKEDAERTKDYLNERGYDFVIESLEARLSKGYFSLKEEVSQENKKN